MPATLSNLGPGFDCFGLAVDLANVVRARPAERWSLSFTGAKEGTLPTGPESLLRRAMERACERFGLERRELEVEVEVRVPPGRGLGSSATAIAAGLALAAGFGGRPVEPEALAELGAEMEGHPDNVVPALFGGLCLCLPEGRGHLRYELPQELRFVALSPESQVSTEKARAALPAEVSLRDAVYNLGRASLLAAALVKGDLEAIRRLDLVRDRLHQPVRAAFIPGFDEAVEAGREAGALGVCISGSGPTVLALVSERALDAAVAEAMSAVLRRHGQPTQVRVLRPARAGVLAQLGSGGDDLASAQGLV